MTNIVMVKYCSLSTKASELLYRVAAAMHGLEAPLQFPQAHWIKSELSRERSSNGLVTDPPLENAGVCCGCTAWTGTLGVSP